jgi:hypothetical protein
MRISFLVAVLMLVPIRHADAQISQVERDALIELYNSTGGASWSDNTNWLGSLGTECTWYGVTCNSAKQQVRSIDLEYNNLDGSLPNSIGDFTALEWIYLRLNHLSGGIPPELGNLSGLIGLDLSWNRLSGGIPPELANLSSLQHLWLESNQLSGVIPLELGNLSNLRRLRLYLNRLSGSIPPELGNLSNLRLLLLDRNQLSGNIPPDLGNLSNLTYLWLHSNQLNGNIPPELGNLSSLSTLDLSSNRLSGGIPPELGSLSNLQELYLNSNRLRGAIPTEFEGLSSLWDGWGLDLRWNAVHSDNAAVIAFLTAKQRLGGDWQSTQTIAPENLAVDSVGDHTVWLRWDAVSYQSDPGGYEVFSAPTGTDKWTSRGWTEAKTEITFPVTGLDSAIIYDFVAVSHTDPHSDNQNMVMSDTSSEAMATTTALGCVQPTIEISWGSPIRLTVQGDYDSYVWSTGETAVSISINPESSQWYWVSITSFGPCEESATILVDPTVFLDGFELGNTTEWSATATR